MKNLLNKLEIDTKTCERINEAIEYFKSLEKDVSGKIFRFIEDDLSKYLQELLDFKKTCGISEFNEQKAKKLNKKHDDIMHKGEALTDSISSKIVVKQIRAFFRDVGSTLIYESEMFELGFRKPRGYPGDFEMMNYVYNNQQSSPTPFGLYMDDYFISNGYAEAVRGRKNKMRDILIDIMSKNKNPRILNIPCGPSRDVQEALLHFDEKINAEIICVDNDLEAIEFSKNSVAQTKNPDVAKIEKGNILDYVRYPAKYKESLGEFDYVYSIGIADYFPDKFLQRFIRFCFNLLKKKGALILAFKIKEKDSFAPIPCKWFCDWEFVPRSQEDSLRVIENSKLEDYKIIDYVWEESNRVCFISIEKG